MKHLLALVITAIGLIGPQAAPAATYYVSNTSGNNRNDGLAARWDGIHGPWKSLLKASSVQYHGGDRLLLKCGDIWDETLTIKVDGSAENPVTVASYGSGERPYIRRTIGKGQDCILVDDSCGIRFHDLEMGFALTGIHVRLRGNRLPEYRFYRFENCFFHDITNPKCPDDGEPWGWAITWEGPASSRDIRVVGCIGLRTQGFFNGGSNRADLVFDSDTIAHGSLNQVYQSEASGFNILNCVFVYNYALRYDKWGTTQVIAGNLPGGPGIRYDVKNNEFGWPGDYPGSPDGCGYDFEVDTNGVTFQNNFVHNSYGEGVLFMGGKTQQHMLFADNLFKDNVRFSPRWDCTISLPPDEKGDGTFRNNTFYLWPGKMAFASMPSCFSYEGNNEHPTKPFVTMPLVTHIGHSGAARTYSFACSTAGAVIRYTTDGSLPTLSSTIYSHPITVSRSVALNVKAFRNGYWPSYVNSLAVELRTLEGAGPAVKWTHGPASLNAGKAASISDNFTVTFWAKPGGFRNATPEMGGGFGIPGAGWWKMSEGAGGIIADSAGGSPGTLTGCTWGKDETGTALSFNGASDSVALGAFGGGSRQGVSNNFTIAFWANPQGERATTPELNTGVSGISKQRYALSPQQYSASSGEAGTGISIGTNGVSVFELADNYLPSPLVADRPVSGWHHILVVYRDGQPSLYMDGVLERTGLKSTKRVHPDFTLGGTQYGWYQGKLRDVRVYPRVLSEADIRILASEKAKSIAWTLDESAGTPGLPFVLKPVRRGGGSDTSHAGVAVSIGTNGISVCESSDDYLPSVLVDNRPIAGWTHVAIVYRDKQPSLYLNGVFEKAGCRSDKIVHPVFEPGGSGMLGDVRVYDHPLTDAEVQELASRWSSGARVR